MDKLNIIDNKLGPQIPGGGIANFLLGKFNSLWKSLALDRLLNLLILATTLHNAIMLSRNLGETLVETLQSILNAMGIKDPEGQAYDLEEFFGKTLQDWIKGIVGEEVYNNTKATWIKANRILTVANNMLNAIQGMIHAAIQGIEIVGRWVALGFNGMQREGMVSDSTWPWMNENPNFKNPFLNYMEKLENLEEAAESINMLAQTAIEFQDSQKELVEARTELSKQLADAEKARSDKEKADDEASEVKAETIKTEDTKEADD